MHFTDIAELCHTANKALCEGHGDYSQKSWPQAPDWQRESALKGVIFCLQNPDAPASANHNSWMHEKLRDGWVYGPQKNSETREHPCMVPYEELPPEQQAKDHLFKAIVEACRQYVELD